MSHSGDIPVDPTSKRQRLGSIVDHPDRWKVCEGCDRVVDSNRAQCPHCKSYRFDRDAARVRAAAKRAARQSGDELPSP